MKKTLTLIIAFISVYTVVLSQRRCASDEYMQSILAKNPAMQQKVNPSGASISVAVLVTNLSAIFNY